MRSISFIFIIIFFYITLDKPSFADDSAIDCEHATSDYDMGPCSYRDFKKSTEDLENIESSLRKLLSSNKQALKMFEIDISDWQQYMLNRCSDAILGFNEDGAGITSSIARGYCKSELMNKRIENLNNYIQ